MAYPSFTKKYYHDTYPEIDPIRPQLSLAGKTVVITGAGAGIGAAASLSFAKAGAQVGLLSRQMSTLNVVEANIKEVLPEARLLKIEIDITDEDNIDAAFDQVKSEFGAVDIILCNAGILGETDTLAAAERRTWWRTVEVNTKGSYLTVSAFLKVANPDAVVINVSSFLAYVPSFPTYSAYSASKIATIKLFDHVQTEHPRMRVIHLQPGVVRTEILTKGRKNTAGDASFNFIDTPELPADTAVWLSSSEATFLRGKLIWANWDVAELKERASTIAGSRILTVDLIGQPYAEQS